MHAITATAANINILTGTLVTSVELGYVSGVTSSIQTQLNGKQPLDATLTGIAALGTIVATDSLLFTSDGATFTYDNGAGAQSRLGLVIGTNVQAYDADLSTIAGFAPLTGTLATNGTTEYDIMVGTGTVEGSRWTLQRGAAARGSLGLGDIATHNDAEYVRVDGTHTMTATLNMGGFRVVSLGTPTSGTDATTKAYVDSLVSAGATWRNPLVDSDLVDLVSVNPVTPYTTYGLTTGDDVSFIATAAITFSLGGTTYVAAAGDIVKLTMTSATVGDYAFVDTLTAGDRFVVGSEHGSATGIATGTLGSLQIGTPAVSIRKGDLIEFVSGTGAAAVDWSTPEGRGGNSTNAVATLGAITGGTLYTAGTYTNVALTGGTGIGARANITVTGGAVTAVTIVNGGTGYTVADTLSANSADIGGTGSGFSVPVATLTTTTEIAQGITVLVSDPQSTHYGHTYLYDMASNAWVEIAGPGSIGDGVGLSYAGNVLNVNLGAGIAASPIDEVGIDLFDPTTGALVLTDTGSTRDATTTSKLYLLLDTGTTGVLVQSAAGLKVTSATISPVELTASVAGNGLVGGAGTALSVVSATGTPSSVGTLVVTADAVGVALGTTSTTAAAGDHIHAASAITYIPSSTLVSTNVQSAIDEVQAEVATIKTFDTNIQSEVDAVEAAVGLTTAGALVPFTGANYVSAAATIAAAVTSLDTQAKTEETARLAVNTRVTNSYYVYDAVTVPNSTTSHIVNHTCGVKYCNVTVVDNTDNVIIPQSIVFNAVGQLTVTFNTAITCRVIVMGIA